MPCFSFLLQFLCNYTFWEVIAPYPNSWSHCFIFVYMTFMVALLNTIRIAIGHTSLPRFTSNNTLVPCMRFDCTHAGQQLFYVANLIFEIEFNSHSVLRGCSNQLIAYTGLHMAVKQRSRRPKGHEPQYLTSVNSFLGMELGPSTF